MDDSPFVLGTEISLKKYINECKDLFCDKI